MGNEVYDPDWTAKVTVPVRRVGTKWEFFYGGDVPVHEGTSGSLVIPISQIVDEAFLKMVSDETVVKILDEGTKLLVALSDRSAAMAYVRAGRPWRDVPSKTCLQVRHYLSRL